MSNSLSCKHKLECFAVADAFGPRRVDILFDFILEDIAGRTYYWISSPRILGISIPSAMTMDKSSAVLLGADPFSLLSQQRDSHLTTWRKVIRLAR
jgi:hypothetical protein